MFKSRGGLVCPLLALILAFAGGISANAQQVFGNIYGTITDASGGAVTNAKVTITDTSKGTQFVVMSDASGNYAKGQLIPDAYTVTIEAPGFQKVASSGLEVRVDEAARFDAVLKVGESKEVVEVTAAAPLLQTDRADVAQTFDTKQISELPNIGRNTQSMELLNPGTAKLGWQHASDENPQGSVQMVANGQLFDSMGYELDGTTNQDPILGIIVINPTFDSLSEIKMAEQNFDAEFEYIGGGVASYSTKSGTNTFHGDAFEYLQLNTPGFVTSAANPFLNGLPAPVYRQNQFGGSIGGRVIKDKLFFFGDAQLNRESQGGGIVTSVPDPLNRTGVFTDWQAYNAGNYTIYDPTTGPAGSRTPFPGNAIPTNRISPQAMSLINSYFPLPNTQQLAGEPFTNNYAGNGATAITGNQWDTREDYYVNQRNTIFGRYSDAGFTEAAPGIFGVEAGGPDFVNYAGSSVASNRSIAIGWTDTLSPTVVNEFRFGFMRYHVFDVPQGYGTTPATAAGIPGLNLDNTYTSGLPYFNVSGVNGLDPMQLGYALGVNQCNCPLTQTEKQYQFIDNLSKIIGNHTVKVGADLRYAQNLRVPSDNHRAGELTFNPGTTGNASGEGIPLASFLLGDVGGFNRYVSTSTNASESQPRFFWYGQDEWRVNPKLTITGGVRWEMVFPESVNGTGNGATLNLSNGLMYVFGYNQIASNGIQKMNWHNFAPRLGFAEQINSKTVLRGGAGIGYDLGVFGSNFGHNVTQNPPTLEQQSLSAPNAFGTVFNLAQGPAGYAATNYNGNLAAAGIQANGLPAPIAISSNGTFPLPNGINPKFRPATITLPEIYEYNMTLQRQITQRFVVSGGYVGNMNRHGFLGTGQSINPNEAIYIPGQPTTFANRPYYSKYGWTQDLSYYCDCSNENYNSFQATAKINNLAGLTVQGSYTYQRQYGDGWGYDSNYYFNYDRAAGQGYSSVLPRQQYIFSENYDIPFGHARKYGANSNRLVDAGLGGWTISGITTYYSGFPYSPNLSSYPNQPDTGPNSRPNIGSGQVYASNQNRNQWTVPWSGGTSGAFLNPAAYTFGNYPINTLFGPRFIQQDLSLAKTFRITERLGFTLKADSQNAFNHTNLGMPNSNVQSSVGQITGLAAGSSNHMRVMQFSGTLRF
jgi:hypothetical protein